MHDALRIAIYRHWIRTGSAPSIPDLARMVGCRGVEIRGALRELAEAHVIVLAPGLKNIEMAHPFSALPTAYRVESGGVAYWANCAWDALGIAAILGRDTQSLARCGDCAEAVDLSVRDGAPANPDGVVHMLVPAARFWQDIRYT